MKEHIGEEEWEDFQPAHHLSPDISGKLWNNIHKNTTAPAAPFPYFRRMAVAASVVLVVGLSWYFISKEQKTSIISAATVVTDKHIVNNTPRNMTLTLSDGSTVALSPNSTLTCPKNFDSVKRDVILTGEADFTIARDVSKPFSVHSNAVLITVLGTRFTVNAYEANHTTKVILHEGRVRVNDYYLSPGDVCIVKKVDNRSPVPHADPMASAQGPRNDSLSARILHLNRDKDDCYVFDDYPLDVTFDQLQMIYHTKIVYNEAALGNRSFIGKIDRKDSLYHILKSIALLNNFDLQKQGDRFIISRPGGPY